MRLRDVSFETSARTTPWSSDTVPDRGERHSSVFSFGHDAPDPLATTASRFGLDLRALLSNLAKGQSAQRTPQRIVIAGASVGGAASIVAWGLAMTAAASGFRTLLVDANLDAPTVHDRFVLNNDAGVSTLLAGTDSPNGLPRRTGLANLSVMTAGPRLQNGSSLLVRERLFHRLNPIAEQFDYLIVDCGALSASLLGRVASGADNVIVAVKEHVSSMHELANIVRTLQAEAVADPAVLMIE